MNNAPMSLSEALQAEVEDRAISWREAGRLLGVPYQTLSNWATGKYRPSRPEDMRAIGEFLGVSARRVREMRALDRRDDAARLDAIEARLSRIEALLTKLPVSR